MIILPIIAMASRGIITTYHQDILVSKRTTMLEYGETYGSQDLEQVVKP